MPRAGSREGVPWSCDSHREQAQLSPGEVKDSFTAREFETLRFSNKDFGVSLLHSPSAPVCCPAPFPLEEECADVSGQRREPIAGQGEPAGDRLQPERTQLLPQLPGQAQPGDST